MTTDKIKNKLLKFQQDEIDGTEIYKRLAKRAKSDINQKVLLDISAEEYDHYNFILNYTGVELKYNYWKVMFVCTLARILGLTFVLRMMENGEGITSKIYTEYEQLESFAKSEAQHEKRLLALIDEKRLRYMGAIVLGLNDALVEFTGALAGYTLALSSSPLIALTGSITGIAAAMSMGSSEYLSTKSEKDVNKHPLSAAIYTSMAYLITVFILIAPFIWIKHPIVALLVMLVFAVLTLIVFNFYYAIVRGETFHKRFTEMAVISFSVAALSFVIGYLLKIFTGIDA